MNHDRFRDFQQRSGLSLWELGDLLGIHPHHLYSHDSAGGLLDQPVRVLIDLARHLDLHPADLVTGLGPLLDYQRAALAGAPAGDDIDARAMLAALANARTALTRDDLAAVLGWTLDRTAAAIEYAAAKPELAGPLALRRTPDGYRLGPRLDLLTAEQHANLTDLDNHREPLTDDQLAALLAVHALGRLPVYEDWRAENAEVEQQLKDRDMIRCTNGPHHAEVHPDVLFSLRLLTDEKYRRYIGGLSPGSSADAPPEP